MAICLASRKLKPTLGFCVGSKINKNSLKLYSHTYSHTYVHICHRFRPPNRGNRYSDICMESQRQPFDDTFTRPMYSWPIFLFRDGRFVCAVRPPCCLTWSMRIQSRFIRLKVERLSALLRIWVASSKALALLRPAFMFRPPKS